MNKPKPLATKQAAVATANAAGLLTGGTIAAISFHSDAGALAGRITCPGSAGIGLAAAALVAPGADPAALFADWQTR